MLMFFTEELFTAVVAMLTMIPSMLLGIASYALSAVAIYVIARRRGLKKPWLAWIPVVNVWLLGSLSDQYNYLVRRKITSCRKWLLVMKILKPVLAVGTLWFGGILLQQISYGVVLRTIWDLWLGLFGFGLPLLVVAVWSIVLRYMALYDVYKSLDPNNAVLFLVLSVFVSVTEPFFLFFNRAKDGGMPPRREPVYEETRTEHWEYE